MTNRAEQGATSPGLGDRLRFWKTLRGARPVAEEPDVAGGREAELLLSRLVGSSHALKNARLLTGRRIPSRRQGRRREIDLIVCTPRRIHLIEIKNWSGRLTVENGAWRQTRRGGDVVDHGDLLRENERRRDAVVEYLNDRGVAIDDQFARARLVPEIIFMNPGLDLAPEVEARPDVFSRRELDQYLGRPKRRGLAERLFASLVDCCLARESSTVADEPPIDPAAHDRIVACLVETGTWDRLHLHGSRVVTGDVVSLTVAGRTQRADELAKQAAGAPIRLGWARNPWIGLLLAVTNLRPLGVLHIGATRRALSPDDAVFFHAVGDREPRSRRLVEVDRIELGSPPDR